MCHELVFLGLASYICKIKLPGEGFYTDFPETLEVLQVHCRGYLLHLRPTVI